MTETPTIGALYRAAILSGEEIEAAVNAFLADPITTCVLGTCYEVDLAEAVRSHEWASVTVGTPNATEHLKRTAVRTAIMLARPRKMG